MPLQFQTGRRTRNTSSLLQTGSRMCDRRMIVQGTIGNRTTRHQQWFCRQYLHVDSGTGCRWWWVRQTWSNLASGSKCWLSRLSTRTYFQHTARLTVLSCTRPECMDWIWGNSVHRHNCTIDVVFHIPGRILLFLMVLSLLQYTPQHDRTFHCCYNVSSVHFGGNQLTAVHVWLDCTRLKWGQCPIM